MYRYNYKFSEGGAAWAKKKRRIFDVAFCRPLELFRFSWQSFDRHYLRIEHTS